MNLPENAEGTSMDQAPPSAAPISKQPRKWLRRLALVFLFFALVIGGVVLFFLRAASSELNDVIAEMAPTTASP
jgi:hypothetical protein